MVYGKGVQGMEKRTESGEIFLKILNARILVNSENSEKMSLIPDHLFSEELDLLDGM